MTRTPATGSPIATPTGEQPTAHRRTRAGDAGVPRPAAREGRAAWSATPGTTCAASRCSGSRRRIIALFLRDGGLPVRCSPRSTRPTATSSRSRGPAVGRRVVRLRRAGPRRLRPRDLRRARVDRGRPCCATLGTVLIGGAVGHLAGYLGGWVDALLSRFGDIFLGLPFVLGAIVILATFNGPGTSRSKAAIMAPGHRVPGRARLAGRDADHAIRGAVDEERRTTSRRPGRWAPAPAGSSSGTCCPTASPP